MRVNSQDHGRSQVYMFRQDTQAETDNNRSDSRDKLQQLRFITYVLTTMKSPHLFSADSDLLTPHDQLRRHVRFRQDQLVARRTSPGFPKLAHALLFARFLGRRPVLLDRVFLRVCESKAAIPSYTRSAAFMATAHTAHCVITELVPRH